MFELEEAANEGRLIEAFASGTAWFVAPVAEIHFKGKDYKIPQQEGDGGRYTRVLKKWLKDIMWGNEEHEWGVVVEEK